MHQTAGIRGCAGAISLLAILLATPGSPLQAEEPLLGFSRERAAEERRLEAGLDALSRAENLRVWMARLAGRPHHVGSAHGRENADFMAGLFRSWGYATRIDTFQILFPTPRERRLQLLAPEPYTARRTSRSSICPGLRAINCRPTTPTRSMAT